MPFCSRLRLFLAASLVLLGASSNAEAPESKFRQSLFRLDGAKLRQSMFLEATLRHKVPAEYSCSSLEGSSCLYSQGNQHPVGKLCLPHLLRAWACLHSVCRPYNTEPDRLNLNTRVDSVPS